jgi:hypothetical protein
LRFAQQKLVLLVKQGEVRLHALLQAVETLEAQLRALSHVVLVQ